MTVGLVSLVSDGQIRVPSHSRKRSDCRQQWGPDSSIRRVEATQARDDRPPRRTIKGSHGGAIAGGRRRATEGRRTRKGPGAFAGVIEVGEEQVFRVSPGLFSWHPGLTVGQPELWPYKSVSRVIVNGVSPGPGSSLSHAPVAGRVTEPGPGSKHKCQSWPCLAGGSER